MTKHLRQLLFAAALCTAASATQAQLTDIKVSVVGNDAIVRHTWDSVSESDGKSTTSHIGVLQVWAKQDGKWKCTATHVTKVEKK